MDESEQRSVAQGLVAKKDTVKRQQQALRSLRSQVDQGVWPGASLLQLLSEVIGENLQSDVGVEAAGLLAAIAERPELREKCSVPSDLFAALLSCLEANERAAVAALKALRGLAPDDFVKILAAVEPEVLVQRVLQLQRPAVRATAVETIGIFFIKAWPCVTAGQDETLRDGVLEALRLILGRLSMEGESPNIQSAAAAVLDALLSEYLRIDPPCFAPIALLHPAWNFGTIYGTLLVELMHVIEPAISNLSSGSPPLLGASCPWLPCAEGAEGIQSARTSMGSDWQTCCNEAVAFRVGLLWLLAEGGGLTRRYSEQAQSASGERCGSLIFDLVRELSCGRRSGTAPEEIQVAPHVRQALERATQAGGSSWGAQFSSGRAKLMLLIVDFARGSLASEESASSAFLDVAGQLGKVSGTGTSPDLLVPFAAEAMCSVLATWSLLVPQPAAAALTSSIKACAQALMHGAQAGPSVASTSACSGPPRLLRLMSLASWVLIRGLTRLRGARGQTVELQPLFPAGAPIPALILALLSRDCCAMLRSVAEVDDGSKSAAIDISCQVLQLFSPRLFVEVRQMQPAADDKSVQPTVTAASWWLLALAGTVARVDTGRQFTQRAAGQLSDAALSVASAPVPEVATMIFASARDVGGLGQLAGANKQSALDALKRYDCQGIHELERYVQLVQQDVQGGTARLPRPRDALGALLLPVGSGSNMTTVSHLHCLSDAAAAQSFMECGGMGVQRAVAVSGPPLMVYVRFLPSWPSKGVAHVVVRVDIYNATALSFTNVHVTFGVARHGKQVESDSKSWRLPSGLTRPREHHIEAMPCRVSTSLWHDFLVTVVRPLCVTVAVSYDNIVEQGTSTPQFNVGGGTGDVGRAPSTTDRDAWSDDEDDEHLRFKCCPCLLPMSVYVRPFHGFDSPLCSVFPPPAVFAVCPHSFRIEQLEGLGVDDPQAWNPAGFHRLAKSDGGNVIAPDVVNCYAGIALDGESLLCLLYRTSPGSPCLELRSNSETLLNDFQTEFRTWLFAAASA